MKLSSHGSQWRARFAGCKPSHALIRTKKALSLEGSEDSHFLVCRRDADSQQ